MVSLFTDVLANPSDSSGSGNSDSDESDEENGKWGIVTI